MDLESLTRYQLEQEAEKAGVKRVHDKTREQLIAEIGSGARSSRFGTARKLLGRAVKIARAFSERPEPSSSAPPRELDSIEPETTRFKRVDPNLVESKSEDKSEKAAAPTTKIKKVEPSANVAPTAKRKKVEDPAEAEAASVKAAEAKSATPTENTTEALRKKDKKKKKKKDKSKDSKDKVKAKKKDKSAKDGKEKVKAKKKERSIDEPVPTRTMARLLGAQGHPKRALAIYERLLKSSPNDSELAAEMNALKDKARSRGKRDDADPDGSEVVVVNAGEHRALISWTHEEQTEELIGLDAPKLSLKTVLIWTEAGRVMKRKHVHSIPATGEHVLELPATRVSVVASVGFAQLGTFRSVSHSDIVSICQ